MEVKVFENLPVYAIEIRNEVFVDEQGFVNEFDDADNAATHLVGFIDGECVATSRVIKQADGSFIIGRIAVKKAYRGLGYGAEIIRASEKLICEKGGREVYIHAQTRAVGFYEKQGYFPIGYSDEDEGCPHEMLRKQI